jgi:hypothetical protein
LSEKQDFCACLNKTIRKNSKAAKFDMQVAIAAPSIPIPIEKIKIGSSINI